MSDFDALGITDFDHLEFAVSDLEKASELYSRMGFERIAERELFERKLRSCLFVQNNIFIVLSHSTDHEDFVARYVSAHGDGVCSVGFGCENAVSAFEITLSRGAQSFLPPKSHRRDFGEVEQASIRAFGDVQHTFVSRRGNLFLEGFELPIAAKISGNSLEKIDHITTNVEKGRMDFWADYYEKIFGLKNTRFFDTHTTKTGLSKVMQSPNGVIKMPFNEPSPGQSQIQEFIDIHHGPGVQHVALFTHDILRSVRSLRKNITFLDAPPQTYYEILPERVPNVAENLSELRELAILVDGDKEGYLLQLFTQNVVGPFFYEIIQRKGNNGFGEGNGSLRGDGTRSNPPRGFEGALTSSGNHSHADST